MDAILLHPLNYLRANCRMWECVCDFFQEWPDDGEVDLARESAVKKEDAHLTDRRSRQLSPEVICLGNYADTRRSEASEMRATSARRGGQATPCRRGGPPRTLSFLPISSALAGDPSLGCSDRLGSSVIGHSCALGPETTARFTITHCRVRCNVLPAHWVSQAAEATEVCVHS